MMTKNDELKLQSNKILFLRSTTEYNIKYRKLNADIMEELNIQSLLENDWIIMMLEATLELMTGERLPSVEL